jgi:hypothetical protein
MDSYSGTLVAPRSSVVSTLEQTIWYITATGFSYATPGTGAIYTGSVSFARTVPEPPELVLLGIGLIGWGVFQRKKKNQVREASEGFGQSGPASAGLFFAP